jgi:NTE family protein
VGVSEGELDTIDLLRGVPILAGLEASLLGQVAAEMELLSVPAGEWLFRAGDEADVAYVIASGRLEVLVEEPVRRSIAVLRRGASIGEIGLLQSGRRTASVRAHRDSTLISLRREQFELLMAGSPAFALGLSRALAERLMASNTAAVSAAPRHRSFAIVTLDGMTPVADAAAALVAELSEHGETVRMTREMSGAPEHWPLVLGRLEAERRFVMTLAASADPEDPWTSFCLREADRIIAVASRRLSPEWSRRAAELQGCELVLIGVPAADSLIDRLEPSSVRAIRTGAGLPGVMREIGRRAGGRSVGLVLSGGGARALSHVGVIEELIRAGIRIERAAGVSLGAIVAALLARGDSPAEIVETLEHGFMTQKPTNDYTLPMVSLIRGRKTARMLLGEFGSQRIEELEIPFACTSSDLVNRRLVVHRTGSLNDALRASLSIPGVFPPTIDRHGRLLVDGGVLDNLPLRATLDAGDGPVIAVDVTNTTLVQPPPARLGWGSSAVHAVRRAITGTAAPLPRLTETIVRCMTFASADTVRASRQHADLVITPDTSGIGLMDWRRLPEMRAAGVAAARQALSEHPDFLSLARE